MNNKRYEIDTSTTDAPPLVLPREHSERKGPSVLSWIQENAFLNLFHHYIAFRDDACMPIRTAFFFYF